MILIKKLVWDSWNVHHIARHNVIPDEVESVCHGSPLIFRGQQKNRILLVGPTEEKRMITVVLEPKRNGIYYTITAYPADKQDIVLYNRLKGGENNNEENN